MTAPAGSRVTVGVISDTHGLLRDAAVEALRGVDHIVHGGDVGNPRILDRLGALAPVTAVRGNVDLDPWAERLPRTAEVELAGAWFHVLHILDYIDLDPAGAGFHVVVHGHSHHASIESRNGVLYVNPGSAGPRRFRLPVTLALLDIHDSRITPRLVNL